MYSNKTNIQTILKSQVFKLVKCSDYRFGSSLTLMDRAKYGGWAAKRGLRGGVHSLALEYQILIESSEKFVWWVVCKSFIKGCVTKKKRENLGQCPNMGGTGKT